MPSAALRVERPGLLTSIQDLGRVGHQREGMVVAGAMDPLALQVANLLVGNRRGDAALEITLLGPTFTALSACVVALCGADLSASLDGELLPLWKSVLLQQGQTLRFGAPRAGARAYLAIAGGFSVPGVMGSKSTFLRGVLGGFHGRALQVGDVLENDAPANDLSKLAGHGLAPSAIPMYREETAIAVVMGPQQEAFTEAGRATFLSATYEVTHQSDRMGYRLAGPAIEHGPAGADILSEAAPLGAIQVPAHGQPIILMADRQTTGGYDKIATIISADISQVAQLAPGHRMNFHPVSLEEAQARLWTQGRLLNLLEVVTQRE